MAAHSFRQGKAVTLKPLGLEHVRILTKWLNDKEISEHFAAGAPVTEQQQAGYILYSGKDRSRFYFACYNAKDQIFGIVSLTEIDWPHRNGTVGVMVGNKRNWGTGLALEALMLLLDFSFNVLDLHVVAVRMLSSNARAISTAAHIGFIEVGKIPEWHRSKDGRRVDQVIFVISQENWRPLWDDYQQSGRAFLGQATADGAKPT